jgi:DNA polymerase I-like protein with 3'-5' exonuclease and polymerase domains
MTPEFDPRRLRYATTPAQVGEFLGALEAHSGPVVLDGETTGRKTVDQPWSRIACMAFALPRDWDDTDPAVWAVALSHPQAATREGWRKLLTEIAGVIEDRGFDLVNQNLPFDLKWVRALTGIDLSAQAVWDTAMAARLLQDEGSVGLKTLVPKMFDIEAWDDGIDFHQRELEQNAEARATGRPPQRRIAERVPFYELAFYAALDVAYTWKLAQAQQETFASWDDMDPEMRQLGRLHEIVSVPTVRAMTRLSGNGLLVDREWMADKRAELVTECEKVDQQITDLSGLDPCSTYEPSSKIFRDWADRKAAEGLLQPVAVTKTGKISWSYSSLVANRQAGHEMADLLIQYRKASKQVQMLDSWTPFIGADGRVRPNYNLYRTVTGRLSSSDPNGQQLARVLKPMVIAPPGKVILEADLSQAELRIMAFVAPSEPMKQALIRGDDLHRMVAAEILGVRPEDVTKDGRQKGKAINFGFGFTMREEKFIEYAAIQYDTHFSYEEAVAARRAFFDLWEGLEQWHQRVEYEVLSDGYVVSPIGRIRRPAGAKGDYRQQYRAISQATNAPVQGFVSDIMMISAGLITTEMPWITPVACVHDSFVFEVPEDRVQEAAAGIRHYMAGEPLYIELRKLGCELDVPLVVDVKSGPRWGIGDEL